MSDLTVQKQDAMLSIIEKVATDPNCDVSKMEKMLDMQERIFNKNAEIEFNRAMVAAQKEMPMVVAKAMNTQTGSLYAKYEHLLQQIKPVYTKHGFSLSFGEAPCSNSDMITVTCEVMHEGGHTKSFSSTLPIDSCGIKGTVNKTGIHATASAYSYAKRYLATMIFNLAIADHDDDAVKAGGITIEQLLEFNACLRDNIFTISAVKEAISNGDFDSASESWHELSIDEKRTLFRAPTKGGIFTTEERKIMTQDNETKGYFITPCDESGVPHNVKHRAK